MRVVLPLVLSAVLGLAASVGSGSRLMAQSDTAQTRPVTLRGCITPTGRGDVFILGVRGDFADPDRGSATGEPVPPGVGVGPEPGRRPQTIPPPDVTSDPNLPPGRYSTPTIRNLTYRLENVDPQTTDRLRQLVGKEVEVTGRMPVEGYPTGDLEEPGLTVGRDAVTPIIPLSVTDVRKVSDVCLPEHLSAPAR